MAISRTIQGYLSKGDFEALEDDWLAAVSGSPEDLSYFVGIARALLGTDEADRARYLLELLDAELQSRELWAARLKLLERTGTLLLDEGRIHHQVLVTLHHLYRERPNLEVFIEAVGLTRAVHDLPKTWEKVERLHSLVAFDVGTVVAMEKKGVGRVVELNRELESFKIDFERFPGLLVGFRAAAKLLVPLPPRHILRRKLEGPAELARLVKEDPSELLHLVLESYGRPLTAGEVREALAGIVDEKDWTSFWNAARKHPQVVATGTGARQTYQWAGSGSDALDTVWQAFQIRDPRGQIELMKREGGRDEELARRMAERLRTLAQEAMEREPGLAFEAWFALERAGQTPDQVPWAPEGLLRRLPPSRVLGGVQDRGLREHGYRLLRELRPEWPVLYLDLLAQEGEPKALDVLVQGLREEAPRDLERFLDGLLAQPQKNPAAFYWLADRAAVDEELRARNPLRLLQHILQLPNRDEFAAWRARFPALVESGGTVPRLLAHLTPDQAPQAAEAIHRAPFLESYQREALSNALQLRFPAVLSDPQQDPGLYALPESIAAKRAEFEELVTRELPANRKAIEEARALGDLRENFEYKSARQRHEYLSARAAQLEGELANVQPIGVAPAEVEDVRIGTRVRLARGEDQRSLTILGPWESDPEAGVLSYQSDLAQALLGKKPGDTVTVEGDPWTVAAITPWR